jgi:hypothetical protein
MGGRLAEEITRYKGIVFRSLKVLIKLRKLRSAHLGFLSQGLQGLSQLSLLSGWDHQAVGGRRYRQPEPTQSQT